MASEGLPDAHWQGYTEENTCSFAQSVMSHPTSSPSDLSPPVARRSGGCLFRRLGGRILEMNFVELRDALMEHVTVRDVPQRPETGQSHCSVDGPVGHLSTASDLILIQSI